MLADKIKKPILLIHGDEDNNSGTLTMQVYPSFSLVLMMMHLVWHVWFECKRLLVMESCKHLLSEADFPTLVWVQSERFFNALKGHGALCRLVLLPLESHGFSARESVMHCLWEMDRWLEQYCVQAVEKPTSAEVVDVSAPPEARPAGATSSDLVAVASGENQDINAPKTVL